MGTVISNPVIEQIVASIEIPDSAYETAESRYRDLGSWLGRHGSNCFAFSPHVSPQGSFRLGTVTRPLDEGSPYDLDLGCNLERGISKNVHTQEQLKNLVGLDVESYRIARSIQERKEEKHRCWRLWYADHLSFHIDIVPCIPEELHRRKFIEAAMVQAGSVEELAHLVADLTVNITDNRHPKYRTVAGDWKVSNPEGYARWFESRMKLATALLEHRRLEMKAAKVEDLPAFRWKTPLQRCIQVLKRHRDVMFAQNVDLKPISIVITTLAARAYTGEADLGEAVQTILTGMGALINPKAPRVPNPVNPAEDFADRWATPEGRTKKLEENFRAWLAQATVDFEVVRGSRDSAFVSEQAMRKFGSRLSTGDLRNTVVTPGRFASAPSKPHNIVTAPAKPWRG